MRWLCFLLLASPALARGQTAAGKPLRFDLSTLPATRDSFIFRFHGQERGWAVWQYEIRRVETTEEVLYTAASEFQPLEEERLRIVLDRQTGAPISSFHRIDMFSPASDTVMVEHDLVVKQGAVTGRRRVGTKSGAIKILPVNTAFPAGTVFSDYFLFAGAVTNALPGDSLGVRAYREFGDSLYTLTLVAEPPTTILVRAGTFAVLPLRSGEFRIWVTRREPRRVVKGATLDGAFTFELVRSGPVIPLAE